MKIQCAKCLPKEGIECPDFSPSEKNELSEMVKENPLKRIVYIRERYNLSLEHAKYIVMHINDKIGNCNRCSFDNLIGENTNCPQCGAFNFNFNWKKTLYMQTIPKHKFSTTISIEKQKVLDFFSDYIEHKVEDALWETYVCKDGSLLVLRPDSNEANVWVYFHLNITVDQPRQSIGFIGINWMMNFCKMHHSEIMNVSKKIVLPVSEGAVMSVIYTCRAFRIAEHYACNPKDRQKKGKE